MERATSELFFVDPWGNAEFVSRFLPYVPEGVSVRLLVSRNVKTLMPAVDMFAAEHGLRIAVRVAKIHERYLFVDRKEGVQSGASFHDGAKHTGTAVIALTDAFEPVLKLYENYWDTGNVERP